MWPATRLPALSGALPGSLPARGAARARRSPRWATAPARTCGSWRCWAARARRGGAAARTRACRRASLAWPAFTTSGRITATRPPAVRRQQRPRGQGDVLEGSHWEKKNVCTGCVEATYIRTCWEILEGRKTLESIGAWSGSGPQQATPQGGFGHAARPRRRGAPVDHGARGRGRKLRAGRCGAAAAGRVRGAVARAAAGARGRRAARQQAPPRGHTWPDPSQATAALGHGQLCGPPAISACAAPRLLCPCPRQA